MRRGRQEEPVLEAAGQVAQGTCEFRLDAVTPAARRRRMVRLVEDEQASRQERSEPLAQRIRVSRIDEQIVGNEKTAVGAPRVDAEPTLAAHSSQVRTIENLEDQAKPVFKFPFPLL